MNGERDLIKRFDNGLQVSEDQTMNTQFYSLLKEEQDDLVSETVNRLKTSAATHYSHADANVLRSRFNKLVQEFILSAMGEQEGFAEYVQKISKDRIREGYDLSEVQDALNTIENLIWRLCTEKVSDEKERLEDLYLITNLIDSAKDRLARQYLEASQDAVASATPVWRKMQDAEVFAMRRMEEGWADGSEDRVNN